MSASTQVEIGKRTRERVLLRLEHDQGQTADEISSRMGGWHRNTIRAHLLALVRSRKARKKVEGRKTLFFLRVK